MGLSSAAVTLLSLAVYGMCAISPGPHPTGVSPHPTGPAPTGMPANGTVPAHIGQHHRNLTKAQAKELFMKNRNATKVADLEHVKDKLASFRAKHAHDKPKAMSKKDQEMLDNIAALKKLDNLNETKEDMGSINKPLEDYLFQGDIVLSGKQADTILADNKTSTRAKRQAQAKSKTLWDPVDIPFSFTPGYGDDRLKSIIRLGIKFWQDNTCLTFKENGPKTPTLQFFDGGGCFSMIGNVSGSPGQSATAQKVSIAPNGCDWVNTVCHEVAHALGFFHEQSRWDRDQFITVNTAVVAADKRSNYDMETQATNNNYGIKYDYGSSMQYADNSFATNPQQTAMIAKEPLYQNTMGSFVRPSYDDVYIMNQLYSCAAKCPKTPLVKCQNSGYPNPKACSTCLCPGGFGGADCSQRAPALYMADGVTFTPTGASCGQDFTATTAWQEATLSLNGPITWNNKTTVKDLGGGRTQTSWSSSGTYNQLIQHAECHWHFKAPAGKTLQILMTGLSADQCSRGCTTSSVEIKITDFTRTGYRFCCSSDQAALKGQPLTTTSNLAIVSMYNILGKRSVTLQYRITQ